MFRKCSWAPALRYLALSFALAVFLPGAAHANSSADETAPKSMPLSSTCIIGVCIVNSGGMATAGVGNLFTGMTVAGANASMVNSIGAIGGPGQNIGSLSFTTGGLLSGSLANGGTFGNGTMTITANNYYGFSGTLFQGTFGNSAGGAPITWTLEGKVGGFYEYELTGPISGTWEGASSANGQTAQFFFYSKTKYNGGPIALDNGTSTIVTPEPGTLGLVGTGFVGIAWGALRRLRDRVKVSRSSGDLPV
jgi:hypothetical protein